MNGKSSWQSLSFSFNQTETIGRLRVGAADVAGVEFHGAEAGCTRGATFNSGQQCSVLVRFAPDHVGEIRGFVSLLDQNGATIGTGFVHGVGSGPRLAFPPGVISTVIGVQGVGAIAADSIGNIYAVVHGAKSGTTLEDVVYRISASDAVSVAVRQPFATFGDFLAADGARNFYFSGSPGAGIRRVGADGTVTGLRATYSYGSVATDGEGNVYAGLGGAVEMFSPIGELAPLGPPLVGARDWETSIDGLVVPARGNLYFSVNPGNNHGAPPLRGKIFQSYGAVPQVLFDGGARLGISGLAQQADGSLIAAAGGTSAEVLANLPVLPIEGSSVAVNSHGDIFVANGNVIKYSLSTPPGLAFSASTPGESVSSTLSVMNTGNQPLVFDFESSSITGIGAAAFKVDSTTCNTPGGVPPAESCTITFSFQSTTAGRKTATFSLVTNDPERSAQPATVALEAVSH